ncbi:caspase family protein [Amycolatopsis sp. NPDC005961]|uniref:caspase, EACC1-associated type n=1 Tax=Amycolatopsis sp. NPDC005961 TaxID=3156720 RepID=UPI0033EB7BBA
MTGRHALLIATETYADPALRRLIAPGGDARALEGVLSDPSIAGFEVTTLIDQPHHVVGEAIGEFYRVRRRDELTLLYFTGHGVKDDDGSLYLAMANTRRDSLMFTALAAELVDRAMAGCPSRQKVLVLDCCYSGAFPAGKLAKAGTDVHTLERFQGRGRAVLTASDATQYSFEGDAVVGSAARSVFTRHLVAGLRDGSADLDGDGDVTVDELYSYVHERVVAEMPRQRPKHQSDVEGRIVLARNPRWTLPEYLRHGLASPIAADRLSALEGLKRLNRMGNAVVRERTATEIRRLVDDDSRAVSGAATAWAAEADSPAGEVPPGGRSPAEEPPMVAVVAEADSSAGKTVAEEPPAVSEPATVMREAPVGERQAVPGPAAVPEQAPRPPVAGLPARAPAFEPSTAAPPVVRKPGAQTGGAPPNPSSAPPRAVRAGPPRDRPSSMPEQHFLPPSSERTTPRSPSAAGERRPFFQTAKSDFLIAGVLLVLVGVLVVIGITPAGLGVVSLFFWFFVGRGVFRQRRSE